MLEKLRKGVNKMAKCPNCGAPMQGNSCPYCHYTEPVEQGNVTGNVVTHNPKVDSSSLSPATKLISLQLSRL